MKKLVLLLFVLVTFTAEVLCLKPSLRDRERISVLEELEDTVILGLCNYLKGDSVPGAGSSDNWAKIIVGLYTVPWWPTSPEGAGLSFVSLHADSDRARIMHATGAWVLAKRDSPSISIASLQENLTPICRKYNLVIYCLKSAPTFPIGAGFVEDDNSLQLRARGMGLEKYYSSLPGPYNTISRKDVEVWAPTGQGLSLDNLNVQDTINLNEDQVDKLIGVITGDLFVAYPDVGKEYRDKSALERKAYLNSEAAESLRAQLINNKSQAVSKTHSITLSELPEYNLHRKAFTMNITTLGDLWSFYGPEEHVYFRSKLSHVLQNVWFDGLPLEFSLPLSFGTQKLIIAIPESKALEIERQRSAVQIKIYFGLTGRVRTFRRNYGSIVATNRFLEAKNPTIVLLNVDTGEMLWSRSYFAAMGGKK